MFKQKKNEFGFTHFHAANVANENYLKHGFPVEQPVQRTRSPV